MIDMFEGIIERPDPEKLRLNYWYDELIWCPSQCYYYFEREGEHFCLYLRWRHQDPWTAELIRCKPEGYSIDYQEAEWKFIKIPYFADHELEKLKEYLESRLDLICLLFPHQERYISLHIEEYKSLPDHVRAQALSFTARLMQTADLPKRKIKTYHAGEIKAFDTLLQMEVRDYLDRHPEELGVGDGLYVNPETADITVTNSSRVTDLANFYPFTSLVIYDRADQTYSVNKDATGNVAFTYYEYD